MRRTFSRTQNSRLPRFRIPRCRPSPSAITISHRYHHHQLDHRADQLVISNSDGWWRWVVVMGLTTGTPLFCKKFLCSQGTISVYTRICSPFANYLHICVSTSLFANGLDKFINLRKFTLWIEHRPLAKLWNTTLPGVCSDHSRILQIGYVRGIFKVLTDLFCTVTPISVLWKFQISTRWKVVICDLMSLGFKVTASQIVRVINLSTLLAEDYSRT